ncbi:MAG: hypothetical protein JW825_06825 [Candidatus Methanofastidiosa archaeon]|nr:hypothetical protein [Candidatus Methanofastidiosa archaeon]
MNHFENVEKRLMEIPGVIRVVQLDDKDRRHISRLEKMAEDNGAAGGMMDFTNKGVWDALAKKNLVLLVADSKQGFRDPPCSWTLIVDEKGNVVGEWIPEEKICEYKERDDVQFLSNDFVLYRGRERVGKCIFMMPPLPFPELDDVEGIKNVVSGTVSAPADAYLKKITNISENFWTIIIGYDLDD